VWSASKHYQSTLKNNNVIIGRDFNSDVIWDKLKRRVSHSMVVEKLRDLNMFSAYHSDYNIDQDFEVHPTSHLFRHYIRPYQIDCCFASAQLIGNIESVEVGAHEQWS
jgi:type IV secretory pathway VirB6-like protein